MLQMKKNLWHCDNAICITTNGHVKKNGYAVMGRGVALQALDHISEVDLTLGQLIINKGNHVHYICRMRHFTYGPLHVFSFPVKHHWRGRASLQLIERSVIELCGFVDTDKFGDRIHVPRPGCGNGGLDWEEVRPILRKYFDDRFIIVYH